MVLLVATPIVLVGVLVLTGLLWALLGVRLLRRSSNHGLTMLRAREVVVTSDVPEIPVGVDGEALLLPTPVRCTVRPKVLRGRVPRRRPGVPPPKAHWDLAALLRLASFSRPRATR